MANANAQKTHCKHGHEFTPENTYLQDGRRSCLTCRRAYIRAWIAANPDKVKAQRQSWRRRNLAAVREKDRLQGQRPEVKARKAAQRRQRRAVDPVFAARCREREAAYRLRPGVRLGRQIYQLLYTAKRESTPGAEYATRAKIAARLSMFNGLCAYCGVEYQELEHVIPLVRGGSVLPANIVPACRPCNINKGWRKPSEWARFRGLVAA